MADTTRNGHQRQHCEPQRSIKNTIETVPLQSVPIHYYHSRICKAIHMLFLLQFPMLTITSSVMFCRGKTRVIQTHHLHEGSWSRDRCSHYDVIYLRTLYSQHSLRATKPSDLCRRESAHRQNTGTKIKEDIFMKHLAKRESFKDTAKCQNTQFKVNRRYSCNGCNRQQRYFISVRSPVSNSGTRFCKQLKILFFYTFQTCSVYSVTITSDTLKNFC